ncbi:hypothetical protein BHU16_09915 [Tannerella sp. oral taxon 808]|nr:hypothetical protein BHU16_09915 [Tannerella sp. oral taxon 808]
MEKFKIDLPSVSNIETISTVKLTLPLHVHYHRQQYDLVKAVDNTKLKMPATLMPGWDKGIGAETRLVRETTKSLETAKMVALDNERDNLMGSIFSIVRGNKHSATEANRDAALRLDLKLHVYYGAQKSPYDVESSLIIGIKDDMKDLTTDITTLGLTASFARLYAANDEYIALSKSRNFEEVDAQLPPASIVRPQTDAAYSLVCRYILASYLNAASDEDRAMFELLIDRMNKVTHETRNTHNAMLADRKPKDPKKPKEPKDPKDPKQPKDPKKPEGGGDDIQLPSEPPKKPDGQ